MKSKEILKKIIPENGNKPYEDVGYTVLEYDAYHMAEECADEIKSQFRQAFGKEDDAKRIWKKLSVSIGAGLKQASFGLPT